MDDMRTRPFERVLVGGGTAAKVGGRLLTYYAKRPFLSKAGKERAREEVSRGSARELFEGLSLLKGTALKMAQQLSLETDLLPEAVCRELARSYHRVPPVNRALVRRVIQNGLGKPPEEIFRSFELTAFAAASLGQVHQATDENGQLLAVKLQYPGIAKTIENDVAIIRQILRPVIRKEQLESALVEVAMRLQEEVDYLKEAENIDFFARHLKLEGVRIPDVHSGLTSGTVLSTTRLPGKTLDDWLAGNPGLEAKETVAARLNEIFIEGLYRLNVIHADPNPGNFIINDDLTVGLVDFGCVKRLPPDLVEHYRQLVYFAAHDDPDAHFQAMLNVGMVPKDLPEKTVAEIRALSDQVARWFGNLLREQPFDFEKHPDFIAKGRELMQGCHYLRRHLKMNPDFLFLERTRYGLLRLFEQMGVRMNFRNLYEW
jgi:predicted unusual protein kinase regulating ubiquinone biosynthesis (AarF/ABC1/UbiB family)